jgi:hypothetical protein
LSSVLEEYTQEGYRVLALAYKGLPRVNYVKVQRLLREDVEACLIFLGLIVMENRLKPETTGIISVLRNASIRTIMVTGESGDCSHSHNHNSGSHSLASHHNSLNLLPPARAPAFYRGQRGSRNDPVFDLLLKS